MRCPELRQILGAHGEAADPVEPLFEVEVMCWAPWKPFPDDGARCECRGTWCGLSCSLKPRAKPRDWSLG